jgi:hypothetical protein
LPKSRKASAGRHIRGTPRCAASRGAGHNDMTYRDVCLRVSMDIAMGDLDFSIAYARCVLARFGRLNIDLRRLAQDLLSPMILREL